MQRGSSALRSAFVPTRRLRSVGRVRLTVPRLRWRPLGGILGPARGDAGQSLAALAFSALTSVVAGLTLASQEDQFAALPGLLLFIPPAIGLRGNVFGPLGSRLSTNIQMGTFSWTWKADSVLGQNLIAVLVNSLAASLGISLLAEVLALFLRDGSVPPIGFSDFVVAGVLGGILASVVVLGFTLAITLAAVRLDLDLDNVVAPMVTAAGDLITLPALVVSLVLVRRGNTTLITATVLTVLTLSLSLWLVRSGPVLARRIVGESLPVLLVAGGLSLLAGIAIESSENRLSWVLLVLLPGYLGTAGALGGILANRLSTKVHLGIVQFERVAQRRGSKRHGLHRCAGGADLRFARHPRRDRGPGGRSKHAWVSGAFGRCDLGWLGRHHVRVGDCILRNLGIGPVRTRSRQHGNSFGNCGTRRGRGALACRRSNRLEGGMINYRKTRHGTDPVPLVRKRRRQP